MTEYKHIHVEFIAPHVVEVRLNRPDKRNAMNVRLWKEVGHCFSTYIPNEPECRCVLLTGAGPVFSAGIDLSSATILSPDGGGQDGEAPDVAKAAIAVLREGGSWQSAWKSLNTCNKPVIAAIQGGCYGAALELVAFCDIRICTTKTVFQAPEVDIGLAADIGGNQMLPKVIGNDSLLRELQMTGRRLSAEEALRFGLVSRVVDNNEELLKQALEIANSIASKSPVAMIGIKNMLNFTRDHSVEDSLRFGLTWNAAMVQANDLKEAGMSFAMKKKPTFKNAPSLLADSKL